MKLDESAMNKDPAFSAKTMKIRFNNIGRFGFGGKGAGAPRGHQNILHEGCREVLAAHNVAGSCIQQTKRTYSIRGEKRFGDRVRVLRVKIKN